MCGFLFSTNQLREQGRATSALWHALRQALSIAMAFIHCDSFANEQGFPLNLYKEVDGGYV